MTDESFKRLCETYDFVAGISFRDLRTEDSKFWEEALRGGDALKAVIEEECPGYFQVREERWNQVRAMKEAGASSEEVAAACDAIIAQRGIRVFV